MHILVIHVLPTVHTTVKRQWDLVVVSDGTISNKRQMKDMKIYLVTEIIIYTNENQITFKM